MENMNTKAKEILERIKASKAAKAANNNIASESSEPNRDSFKSLTAMQCDNATASKHSLDLGATLLNNDKEGINIFKAVAPEAPGDDCQVNGLISSRLPDKPLAGGSPENDEAKPDVSLLATHRYANQDKSVAVLDQNAASEVEPEVVESEPPHLINPDFYRLRLDFFDNGEKVRTNRRRVKFTIKVTPTSDDSNPYIVYANFWSRDRDLKKFIIEKGEWNGFYEAIFADLARYQGAADDFEIEPIIAALKDEEEVDENGKKRGQTIENAVAIMWEVKGEAPYVLLQYGKFRQVVCLDAEIKEKTRGSKLMAIGYYKDAARAHLEDQNQKSRATLVKRDQDFFARFG